jgi:hypothetical protein
LRTRRRAASTASSRTTRWRFSSGTAPHCGIWGAQRRHVRPLTLTALFAISQSLTQLPNKSSGVEQAINPYDRPVPRLGHIYVGITACSLSDASTG